jgi:hypothetical protein
MKLDGITPSQGPGPVDRNRKADSRPKPDGKPFADLLGKAKEAGPAPGAAAPAAGSEPAVPPPMGDNLDAIRIRLQTGFYKDAKIDDVLSDKLSGYFDEIA